MILHIAWQLSIVKLMPLLQILVKDWIEGLWCYKASTQLFQPLTECHMPWRIKTKKGLQASGFHVPPHEKTWQTDPGTHELCCGLSDGSATVLHISLALEWRMPLSNCCTALSHLETPGSSARILYFTSPACSTQSSWILKEKTKEVWGGL